MPSNDDINRIDNPIEIAMKMLDASQESVFSSILGTSGPSRKEPTIGGQPMNDIINQVVQNAQLYGSMKLEQEQQNVSAPPIPTDTPVPMPAPAPPTEPEVSVPGGQPQSGMNDIMGMFGGGMNNGNA